MNVNKLKGKIVEKEMSITQLAKEIGIDRSSLYRKLNNEGDTLSIKEANRIVEILGLTREESIAIFLTHLSHVVRIMKMKEIPFTYKLLI